MRRWTEQAIVGNPWSNLYDDQRVWYFDPDLLGWPAGGASPITWTAFPNRLNEYFGSAVATQHNPTIKSALNPDQILELADTGTITLDGTTWELYSAHRLKATFSRSRPNLCFGNPTSPLPDWTGSYHPFAPVGPRGWLDEYCEWAIERDGSGNPVRFEFTCENPDYWFTLWSLDPKLVAGLYQKFANAAVQLDDLFLRDAAGNVIVDETTGKPAYDPINKWNRGTQLLPTSGGAMHLSSPPNTIGAEIYLAAAGTIARPQSSSGIRAGTHLLLAMVNRSETAIRTSASAPTRSLLRGRCSHSANPVGLYLQQPSWNQYTFPKGTTAGDWYTVKRGHVAGASDSYDQILHVTFEGHRLAQPKHQ